MTIYIENLSLRSFFYNLKYNSEKKNNIYANSIIYYIDASKHWIMVANLFGKIFGYNFQKLDFKLRNIKDEYGELLKLRIIRKDLSEIQDQIINSDVYKRLLRKEWMIKRIIDYLQKGILDKNANQIIDKYSISRALFILHVVSLHMKKTGKSKSVLYLNDRGWMNILSDYGLKLGINIIPIKHNNENHLITIINKYPYVYNLLKIIKDCFKFQKSSEAIDKTIPKLFIDGKKNYNVYCDAFKSDFSFCHKSDFPFVNLLVKSINFYEGSHLSDKGIHIAYGFNEVKIYNKLKKIPHPFKTSYYKKARKEFKKLINKYNYEKNKWFSFFKFHNVKFFLSWYKYSNSHMAMADAIDELGGISAIEQVAFDGAPFFECKTCIDVVLGFSAWCSENEKEIGSKIPYYVITGTPVNYSLPGLKEKAHGLRKKLISSGAKKIVAVFDENSGDDDRWHTGHKLQIENFQYLLEEVLNTSWLGVIFKPKKPSTLRNRIKTIEPLLEEAVSTGRCHIFEDSSINQSSVPAVVAALSSDICIHSHLFAGTAGIESAIVGIPTLLIDREGFHKSKLYDLETGKVIFRTWPETIYALYEHFQSENGIPGFGDWSSIINELDPFRDGLAENRKGTYLKSLLDGFNNGLDRDIILADAAEKYATKWGYDKIVSV